MPTLLEVYQQFCAYDDVHEKKLFAPSRRKDILTSVKYLAASYNTTPDQLEWSLDLEMEYRQRLQDYFEQHPKSHWTIRNTQQNLAQLWKAWHQISEALPDTPPPPRPTRALVPNRKQVLRHINETSPYRHLIAVSQQPYGRPPETWPDAIAQRWQAYRRSRQHQIRTSSLELYSEYFARYVSYLMLTPDERLERLPAQAQLCLRERRNRDDLQDILADGPLQTWDELFQTTRLNSFITWHAWRTHPWHHPDLSVKRPWRPSRTGRTVAIIVEQLAKRTHRAEHAELLDLLHHLPAPRAMHDKTAAIHQFTLAELEAVAHALMEEGRRTRPEPRKRHAGSRQAFRFQVGLFLAMAWRCPLRARNWCECLLGLNLRQVEGGWRFHFEGSELKIGMRERGTKLNVFEPDVDPDIIPALEEFLRDYRPHLPSAPQDRHLFLSITGKPWLPKSLRQMVRDHVFRHTGKRLYPHLLRTIFISEHLSMGLDLNTTAYALNDRPSTVLQTYNQLMEGRHRPLLQEANRRVLLQGNGHVLTPPAIPTTLPVARPRPVDPDQLAMDL
jgi:hypothetical protein